MFLTKGYGLTLPSQYVSLNSIDYLKDFIVATDPISGDIMQLYKINYCTYIYRIYNNEKCRINFAVLAHCQQYGSEVEHRFSLATISISLCFISTVIQVILVDRMWCLGTWVVGTQYPQSLGKPEWDKDKCVTRTPSTKLPSHTCAACQRGPLDSTSQTQVVQKKSKSSRPQWHCYPVYAASKVIPTGKNDRKQLWSDLKFTVLPWYDCLCSSPINVINVFPIIRGKKKKFSKDKTINQQPIVWCLLWIISSVTHKILQMF